MEQMTALQKNLMRRATFGDALRRNAKRHPEKPMIVFYDQNEKRQVYTYREINEKANRFANALLDLGIKKGDLVAVMSRNNPFYIICWFGLTKIGAVITGVNFNFRGEEIVYQMNHAEPKAILVEDSLIDAVSAVQKQFTSVRHYLGINLKGQGLPGGWTDFEGLIAKYRPDEPEVEIDDNDLAMIIYTSGTESFPKGVVIQYKNYLNSTIPSWIQDLEVSRNDVFLYYMPFYTIAGLGSFTTSAIAGTTMILPLTVDPASALRMIEAEKVTWLSQTPTFYIKLSQTPGFESCDFSSVQKCTTYGGLIPRFMIEAWGKVAPQMKWGTYWGQSELSQLGTFGWFKSIEDIPDQDPSWIGVPVPTLEVKVVDENNDEVEITSGVGEMICRSPSVMLGYYKDEEKTAHTMRKGWVHTGDLARVDEKGNLFFFDRKKDVIKTGGLNVSSYEVQDMIYKHPKVAEVAVIGIQDPYWSERVTAFIVPIKGQTIEESEIIQLCKSNLAGYKVPKQVVFVEELPKDSQGKILKRELRKMHQQ